MCALVEQGIRFEAWRGKIEQAATIDQLLNAVRLYLAAWTPEAIRLLPSDLAAAALPDADAIYSCAYLASRAELALAGHESGYPPVREMALAMSAAAARLRVLEAYRNLAGVNSTGAGSAYSVGASGRLEAEVRTKA